MVRPSAFAVFRVMTNSNFVGCSIGRSAGFVPFKLRSTYSAARRSISGRSAPYAMSTPASAAARNGAMAGSDA